MDSKSSYSFFTFFVWITGKLWWYWKYNKCNSKCSRGIQSAGVFFIFSVYERNLSLKASPGKIEQNMGCQQGVIIPEKSWIKQLNHSKKVDTKNSSFANNISWEQNWYSPYTDNMDHSDDKVIFHIIGSFVWPNAQKQTD